MKKYLSFVLTAGLALGIASAAVADDTSVMPCSSPENYNSKMPAYCEDFTVSTAEAYDLIVNGIDKDASKLQHKAYKHTDVEHEMKRTYNHKNDFVLLDVRDMAEWVWVGHPGDATAVIKNSATFEATGTTGAELTGKVTNVSIAYTTPPTFTTDIPTFIAGMQSRFGTPCDAKKITFITMSRSGSRSRLAAAVLQGLGYNVLNMDKGFEGGTDNVLRRRSGDGWKLEGYPYLAGENAKGFIDPYVAMFQ